MAKKITIALAGNPNSGKTTIFNNLTGARQHVGNWPGVTVEKKEGNLKFKDYEIKVVDLPGTYSLTAYLLSARTSITIFCATTSLTLNCFIAGCNRIPRPGFCPGRASIFDL